MQKQNYMECLHKNDFDCPRTLSLSKAQLKIPIEDNMKLTQWTLAWCLASAAADLNDTHTEAISKLGVVS